VSLGVTTKSQEAVSRLQADSPSTTAFTAGVTLSFDDGSRVPPPQHWPSEMTRHAPPMFRRHTRMDRTVTGKKGPIADADRTYSGASQSDRNRLSASSDW
jgi:hypothetical protein